MTSPRPRTARKAPAPRGPKFPGPARGCLLAAMLMLPLLAQAQTRVIPTFDCFEVRGTDLSAHLGYISEFTSPVTIPIGPDLNYFAPEPIDRGQPTAFEPGIFERVFTVAVPRKVTELTWTLDSEHAGGGGGGDHTLTIPIEPDDYCDPTTVDELSPARAVRDRTVELNISGGPFTPGVSVDLVRGSEVLTGTVLAFGYERVVATVSIPAAARLGTYDLRLTRSGGDILTFANIFTVLDTAAAVPALITGPSGVLLAGTDGAGIFRSADNAASWQAVNDGLTHLDITALAVAPDGAAIYAGAAGGGAFRSTDGGSTWQAINDNGLDDHHILSLQVLPAAPRALLAGTPSGVFKSTDRGDHWRATNGLP